MPILNFHLVSSQYSNDQIERLLLRSSQFFAEVLSSPIDRVRVFITDHSPQHACVGGKIVSQSGSAAPYFTFIVLRGRSLEDRHRLLAGFTDLIVEILGCPRELIRGGVTPIEPEDWSIGGKPASNLRQAEIDARRLAAAKD